MPLLTVHCHELVRHPRLLEQGGHGLLGAGVVTGVRVNTHNQPTLILGTPKGVAKRLGPGFPGQIKIVPGIQNPQVGISVKTLDELFALVVHVRLHRVRNIIKCEIFCRFNVISDVVNQGFHADESFVLDHAGKC